MKAQDVIGRRIVAIEQTRIHEKGRPVIVTLDSITLDNGKRIILDGFDWGDAQVVRAVLVARAFLARTGGDK